LAARKLQKLGRFYIIGECNREYPVRALCVLTNCIKIILKEKPDVILSTGAAPPCLLCIVGKVFGAKIVWIDSIANVDRLSLSGYIVRPFADLILTQWPQVAEKYKSVYYAGTLV
jgi:UDP-N-acetylglucosamine:LPS N-acetylglucosamine transferase